MLYKKFCGYSLNLSRKDEEHPLSRDELQAKTMRGLAKREASSKKGLKRDSLNKRR